MSIFESLSQLLPFLLQGTIITVEVTIVSLTLGFFFGVILALFRVYGGKFFSTFAALYSILIRAVPLLLLVLILFLAITSIVNLPAFWAGSISLAISSAAYQSEIFRGAILSVSEGQMLAARSIGMSRKKAVFYVILPQAIRLAIPPWSNEAATVLKDSALVYVLGIPEILRQAQYFSARTYQPFLAFGTAGIIYYILTFLTNRALDGVEKKLRIPSQFV